MRRKFLITSVFALFLGVCLGVATEAADSAAGGQYVGEWKGTWEGAGAAGRFDLTLTTGADGKVTGGVSVGADAGDYIAKFISLSIVGNKLTGRYAYTPDEQAEIAVTASFEGGKAVGTWAMVPKGQDTAMANGTWTVAKK